MTSILKTDEIQSQNGGAVVKMQTLKHPSASGNNLELGSDGSATIANGTLSAGTLGSSVVVPASVGSSMVLIKKVDISGTPLSVIFDNSDSDVTFDTTYDNYVFYLSNIVPTTDAVGLVTKLRTNGSDITSTILGGASVFYDHVSLGGGATTFDYGSNGFYLPSVSNTASKGGISATITLYKPADSTITTSSTIDWIYYRSNAYVYTGSGGSRVQAQTLINGIQFYWESSSTFKNVGSIAMYGIKNA
jgi:hypothetical protein